jgi:hypothetical protein
VKLLRGSQQPGTGIQPRIAGIPARGNQRGPSGQQDQGSGITYQLYLIGSAGSLL